MSQTPAQREERTTLGLTLMMSAVACFTMIDSSAKWLVTAGLPAIQVVFVRYAVHFGLAVAVFVPGEGPDAFRANAPRIQTLRSACLFGSTVFNFMSLQFLPLTVTTTIMFAGPIVVTLLAMPMLGERVPRDRVLAVCVGFLGVLVVIRPWGAAFHPAMLLTLCALALASIYFLLTRRLAGVDDNSTSQLWASGLATLCLAPFALADWHWPRTGADWAFFSLIGLFGGTGHIMATTAHRFADASILAPMMYTQIVFAAAASIAIFSVWPSAWTLAGGSIIVCAGIYIWHHEGHSPDARGKRG